MSLTDTRATVWRPVVRDKNASGRIVWRGSKCGPKAWATTAAEQAAEQLGRSDLYPSVQRETRKAVAA